MEVLILVKLVVLLLFATLIVGCSSFVSLACFETSIHRGGCCCGGGSFTNTRHSKVPVPVTAAAAGSSNYGEILEPSHYTRAYPQQTPHSGRHFLPTHLGQRTRKGRYNWSKLLSRLLPQFVAARWNRNNRRFTEGWYYRLTLPNSTKHASFAFIVSIEDPGHTPQPSPLRLVCLQVIGPNDEYLVQGTRNDTSLWAWRNQQGVGCVFEYNNSSSSDFDDTAMRCKTALTREYWNDVVKSGVQVLPNSLLGRLRGRDGTKGGILDDENDRNDDNADVGFTCDFDFTVKPICGWGGTEPHEQKSTAGWLSSFPIFEPHWQITLADARASGTVTWKNTTYHFTDAPFYAEKNWGAALPRKWYWTQCNSFIGYDQLSVVAGGGIRKVPFGNEEALGMVSCHYNGSLYEAVPWLGGMSWDVSTWGSWILRGNSTLCDNPFDVEVIYKCDPNTTPGLVFRAPTADEGLVRFCRDTFEAECTLTLWLLKWDEALQRFVREEGPPLIDNAKSLQGGAEIGGGPWWDDWKGEASLTKPIKLLLRLPTRIKNVRKRLRTLIHR